MATQDDTNNNDDKTTTTTTETPPPPKTETQPEQTGDKEARFTQADIDRVLKERLGRADAKAEERILEAVGLDSLDTLKGVVEAKRKSDTEAMTELEKVQAQVAEANQAREDADKRVAEMQAKQLADGRKVAFVDAIRASGSDSGNHLFVLIQAEMETMFSEVFSDGNTDPDEAKMKALVKEVQNKFPMFFGTAGAGSPSNNDGVNPTSNLEAQKLAQREANKFKI